MSCRLNYKILSAPKGKISHNKILVTGSNQQNFMLIPDTNKIYKKQLFAFWLGIDMAMLILMAMKTHLIPQMFLSFKNTIVGSTEEYELIS